MGKQKTEDSIIETDILDMGHETSVHLKDITGTLGGELAGRKIALCVTASVSITEAPRIARLLMRHGAEVFPVLTPKAAELVSPMIFEWSTGNTPITRIGGRVEHVELVSSNRVDLVLIAPCTANTLGKIANGICDEPVSTVVCTALGARIPVLVADAMHEPMLANPIVQENRRKLEEAGVAFIEGRLEESKSKIAGPEEILRKVISIFENAGRVPQATASAKPEHISEQDLGNFSFLITAGATREPIDSVRFITNASTGKMGVALAEEALARGAKNICLICGPDVEIPQDLKMNSKAAIERVVTSEEMLESVLARISFGKYDALISAGAPADYSPVHPFEGKIRTSEHRTLDLKLVATRKIIDFAKKKSPKTLVVAFKAEYDSEEKDLKSRALDSLRSSNADLIIANNVGRKDIGFGSDYNEVLIVSKDGTSKLLPRAPKGEIADGIFDAFLELVRTTSKVQA